MPNRHVLAAFALIAPLLLGACSDRADTAIEELPFARAQSAVPYDAELRGAPDEDIADITRASLRLWRRQEDGANSVALLRRRATQDIEIAVKILKSFGWYEAAAEVEVIAPDMTPEAKTARDAAIKAHAEAVAAIPRGREGAAEAVPDLPPPSPKARAILTMIPGPRYTLAEHRFVIVDQGQGATPALPTAADLGAPVGGPAAAAAILSAESAALSQLRADGRPWAERRSRRAIADTEAKTLEVETVITSGPKAVYGPLTLTGAANVSDDFLLSYRPWAEGDVASPGQLRTFQQDLARTDLFDSVSVRLPGAPPADAALTADGAVIAPVTAEFEQGEPRTLSTGLRYNSATGPEARLGFLHRNLFNAGERFEAEALAGLSDQSLTITFAKPQFLRPGQELALALTTENKEDDTYESTGIELAGSVRRKLTPEITVGAGGLLEFASVGQGGPRQDVILGGIPLFVSYDGADDPLDPKEGLRASAALTPFLGSIAGAVAPFLLLDGTAAAYRPLDDAKEWVLAGRVRLASVLSAELSDVPAQRRLYSGGGGSVRGYRDGFIGPFDSVGDPTGGRSALELGVELRTPLYGPLRGALFVEAGAVSHEVAPIMDDGVQLAAGVGVRYLSPAGPIRFDVAAPLNPRPEDDPLQIYISIGQAW
ncbi:MAG: translocation and assembly module TamA [Paracoccaceae bacterium]|jgi:translocation and assembly module TamA